MDKHPVKIKIHDVVLKNAVVRLIKEFSPEQVFIFGSVARGTAHEGSDYDLLLVVSQSNEPGYRRAQRAYKLLWGIGKAVDVIIYTRAEFEDMKGTFGTLPETVCREGKELEAA